MLIASVPKNKREEVRVELTEYKGHQLFACRVWARNSEGDAVPTPKGITIGIGLLPSILQALTEAEREAKRQGLLSDG